MISLTLKSFWLTEAMLQRRVHYIKAAQLSAEWSLGCGARPSTEVSIGGNMPQGLLNRLVLRSDLASVFDKGLFPDSGLQLPPPGPPPGTVTTVQGPGLIGFKLNSTLRWLIDV